MHACMYVCMYVCLYVCMYICMYKERFRHAMHNFGLCNYSDIIAATGRHNSSH